MPFWPLTLTKRLVLGVKLTPAQMDADLTDIEGAANALHTAISVALNADGTIKNGAVSTASIQDRAVTLDKLAFLSEFFVQDTGTAGAMAITFAPLPLTAYVQGLVFWVKANATNIAATTLTAEALGAKSVKKYSAAGGTVDLAAGEIVAGNVYILVYDGTRFLVLNPTPPDQLGGIFFVTPQVVKNWAAVGTWATIDVSAFIPATARFALLYCSGLAIEGGGAANACQFTTYFRSDSLGLVYQGLILEGGNISGTPISFALSGQFWVPVKVAGAVVSFDAQLQLTVVGNTDSVSETVSLIGYSK